VSLATFLPLLIATAGVTAAFLLGARIERDSQHRKARLFYRALHRDQRSTSPEVLARDAQRICEYRQEVWGQR
jgi:hypothetical protein